MHLIRASRTGASRTAGGLALAAAASHNPRGLGAERRPCTAPVRSAWRPA
jgi:hypothetical protein